MATLPLDQAYLERESKDEIVIRAAKGQHELDAVFRFRYDHFFNRFPTGYPGVDHEKRRMVEPHDRQAVHLCAFDERGAITAVSSAVPADLESLPDTWPRWFGFEALGAERLARTIVSTRMVLHPQVRRTDLFTRFHRAILCGYREAGHLFAVHYCRPDLMSRYESLGHRRYHKAFHLPSGQLRVPMIMDLSDQNTPAGKYSLPPDFVHPAFCLMRLDERLECLRSRLDGASSGLPWADQPEQLDHVLRQASLLRIDDARCLWQSPDEANLGLVLSGSFAESNGSAPRLLGPGEFIGSHLIDRPGVDCTGISVTSGANGGEILIFAPGLVRAASARVTQGASPAAIWNRLLLTVADPSTQADNPPPIPTQEEYAPCGTP